MDKILLLGAGKIGGAIVEMLGSSGDYEMTVADHDQSLLDGLHRHDAKRERLEIDDQAALRQVMQGKDAVISALPYYLNVAVATTARDLGVHYFDLTEDVETTRHVEQIADGAETAFMPQSGLAPGFISVVAH